MMKQYGAIPFVREDDGIKVVIVTGANGCWLFPKGRYEKELGRHGTAEAEALEEAGVKGTLYKRHPYRTHVRIKSGERVRLTLYPLEVDTLLDRWDEADIRERRVVSIAEAEELMESKKLIACLGRFQLDFPAA